MKNDNKHIKLLHWGSSPEYWRNFIRGIGLTNLDSETIDLTLEERWEIINTNLAQFNATGRVDELSQHTILFKTPADKTWFILRWS